MSVILEVQNAEKYYGNNGNISPALNDLSFTVSEGEFVGIMGASGSGKTTLLNCISTIDTLSAGRVLIRDKNIALLKGKELDRFRAECLGFIFQDFNLLDTHTMFENIAMPLSLAHVDKSEIRSRVEELAQHMQISHLLNKFPNECSGGQRQRAAICRALVNHPRIIVADEPTGNLDSVNSAELMKIFQDLNENSGVTIVMVSHDPLITSYSSRLIYIKDGNIESILEKGDLSQDEYFKMIVDINSAESREILQQ